MNVEEFSFRLESVIRGHHVYKTVWTPFLGETLPLGVEGGNSHDSYAVAILKDSEIVGHAPGELSRIFYFFLSHDGSIEAEVTGHRKFGRGLEVPCWYTLTKYIKRAKKLLKANRIIDLLINDQS